MAMTDLVGKVLDGKYSIEKPLGKGGMGTVYLATHIGTGRPVAVKVIAPDYMERSEFVERFRREAQAAGRLRHPNVVDVTDFGFSEAGDGTEVAYLVMEYLDGCTLGEILDEEKQLPVSWSIDIIEQVCSAIQEAHRQGIIHRDLKPDNIWLEPNQRGGYTVKVLDFGIAKLEEIEMASAAEGLLRSRRSAPATVADHGQLTGVETEGSVTRVDGGSETLVSEGETLALEPEGPVSLEIPSESGTAIMGSDTGVSARDSDEKRTVVAGAGESTAKPGEESPSTAALTRMGAVLGTPLYMSPEQCRGEKLTPRSDIYSLAVVVYQMFSGELPFTGDYVAVMEGHKNQEPPPLNAKKVNRRLRETVMNALAKSPEDRPESPEALANKLRANSEGLYTLLKRSFVLYAERLPKFLLLAIITFTPLIILTLVRVGVNFVRAADLYPNKDLLDIASLLLSLSSFFIQIATAALLVGMTTWVVGQVIAYPLRPINLWGAFREARTKLKSLSWTVIASNLLAMIGFVLLFFPGVWIAARYMLIAPSIMMEGLKGRAAFRRSVELTRRSFRTVFGVALLVTIVPGLLALVMGLSISSIIGNFEKSAEISRLKREGIAPAAERNEGVAQDKKKPSGDLNIRFGGRNIEINPDKDSEEGMAKRFRNSLLEGLFELLWTPIAILFTSFTAVLSSLIYFKTRQAGGESMQELLSKLNSANCPKSKWQERVNRRLVQSGRVSSGSGDT